jgi:hypothetical protein
LDCFIVCASQECYLQAVALLVEDGPQLDRAEYFQLLRMLAWVPDKFMDPETVSVVNFGLTWISVGAPEVTAAMLGEVTNMWISSSNRKVRILVPHLFVYLSVGLISLCIYCRRLTCDKYACASLSFA